MISEITPQIVTMFSNEHIEVMPDSMRVIVLDDEPVALCGIQPMMWGLGSAYAYIRPDVARGKGIRLTREIRKLLVMGMNEFDLKQLRIMVLHFDYFRWAQMLGFEGEGVWKGAGPNGEDVAIMVYERRH